MDNVDDEPIRSLTPFESLYEASNQVGCLLIGYELELISRKVLNVQLVRKSLEILQRKVPTLDLCIRQTGGEHFFYKRISHSLDFEVFGEKDAGKILQDLIGQKYDSVNGPLWRTRLFIPGEYLEESNSYRYKMAFGFHHSMSDGTSNVKTISLFLSTLNDLIDGKSAPEEPKGEIYNAKWYVASVNLALDEIKSNPELKKEIEDDQAYLKKRVSPLSGIGSFSNDKTHPPVMHKITVALDKTKAIIQTFKKQGCSFNSGFLAVINTVIHNIVTKRGLENALKDVVSYAAIDTRRYNPAESEHFGFQAGVGISIVDVEGLKENDIWDHASKIDKHIKDILANKRFFYSVDPNFWNARNEDFLKGFQGLPEHPNFDYSSSNMGNISSYFQQDECTVAIDTLFRTMNVNSLGFCFNVFFHTLHGRLLMAFIANSTYMSESVMEELCKEILLQIDLLVN